MNEFSEDNLMSTDQSRPESLDFSHDQFLTFTLAQEEYAVDILRVQEIRGWTRVTPIPATPSFVKGVINLRGAIVPIIDLRERFGLPSLAYGPTTVVVVLNVVNEGGSRVMGLVVDAVTDVLNLDASVQRAAPDFGGSVDTRFVRGLATVGEQMIIMLDIDRLLNEGTLDISELAANAGVE